MDINYTEIYENFKNVYQPKYELEFRLGYIEQTGFSSNLSEYFFNSILEKLKSSSVMKYEQMNMQDEIYTTQLKNKKKYIKSTQTKPIQQVKISTKENILNKDYECPEHPFDFRVSLSKEEQVAKIDNSFKNKFTRNKERHSFYYKKWRYDLTIVKYEKDNIPYTNYEVELEFVDVKPEELEYYIQSTLCKIDDLFKMCIG